MKTFKEVGEELAAKRRALADFVKDHTADGGDLTIDDTGVEHMKQVNDELNALAADYEKLAAAENIRRENQTALDGMNVVSNGIPEKSSEQHAARNTKSLGTRFVESDGYKQMKNEGGIQLFPTFNAHFADVDFNEMKSWMKDAMTTGASPGWEPDNPRTNIIVESPQRRPVVASLIPQGGTTLTVVKYSEETSFDNQATKRGENTAAAESSITLTTRSANVMTISHKMTVTDEQLEDVPQIQSLIDTRMPLGLDQKEEYYLLSGAGSASNEILGFLNAVGLQTQARSTDPMFDAVLKAMTKVRTSGVGADSSAEPSGMIVNPVDWQDMVLTRTNEGVYIFGNPGGPPPSAVWGLRPVVTSALAEDTALIGDFAMFSHISRKKGVTIEVGYTADDFDNFRRTVRGSMRMSLEIYRPAAFCKITGF